jgi:retinol dehydrogenase 12
MEGRVCVVTGASGGIGLETAVGLAERGATVCVVGRSPARTEAAVARTRQAAQHPDRVSHLLVDFESLESVRSLAAGLLARFERIHVLVNNAGLWYTHMRLAPAGVEATILVNHVAPFLLTELLHERLVRSAPARVVTVSSRLHTGERGIRFEDFRAERRFGGFAAYRQSKLANVLFSNELARRLDGTGVTSNSLHPGDVATEVTRDSAFLAWGSASVAKHFLLTPEEGARTSLHVAIAPELEGVSGQYYRDCAEAPAAHAAHDTALARRLWEETARIAGV